jgi:hypothetical protein
MIFLLLPVTLADIFACNFGGYFVHPLEIYPLDQRNYSRNSSGDRAVIKHC